MLDPKRRLIPEISDEREALIQASIANDPDNPEITATEFAEMRPASEVLPPEVYAALTRPRGRTKPDLATTPVKVRLDPKTVEAFKAAGPGWQTRMNDWLAARQEVVDLIVTFEASANAMRVLLRRLKEPHGGVRTLQPDQVQSIESVERQIAMTENAASGVRKVLSEQAILGAAGR